MTRWMAKLSVLALTLFLFAGCGSDDDNGDNGNGNGNGGDGSTTEECLEEAGTGDPCDDYDDCHTFTCICADGNTSGNHTGCAVGECADPESFCPGFCDEWEGECERVEE